MKFLTAQDVLALHELVINPGELQGVARNKSIEAVIARVENRLHYGMISDVFELAACYAAYIAIGHAFNDANKRTAFAVMDLCLVANGIELSYDTEAVGDKIRDIAQHKIDESDLARWLRQKSIV